MAVRAFDLDIHTDPTPDQEAAARAMAANMDELGVDTAPEPDASLDEVLAHLVMFAPGWLFAQRWVLGWIAVPSTWSD